MKTNDFVEQLNISSIKISNIRREESIYIDFIINNEKAFYIFVSKIEDFWIPESIYHEFDHNTHLKNQTCPFCKSIAEGRICYYLEKYETELFKIILKHPSVRIKLITEGIAIKYAND